MSKSTPSCLAGGGEAGALARSVDWATTPLGPPETWSQALRSAAALVLHNDWQMLLWWGPDLIQIYNDAYTPVLGDKHPRAMGQRFRDCWSEVFHILGPMAEEPYRGGPPTVRDDIALAINRRVPLEESHFRLAYSPVPDDTVPGTGIGGVLATLVEITQQVYGDRQLRTLRELATQTAPARTVEQACELAATTLAANPWDIPFALFYLVDDSGTRARLAARTCVADGGVPVDIDLAAGDPWHVGDVVRARTAHVIDDLAATSSTLPNSPWGHAPTHAVVLPLTSPDQPLPYGVLVCGANPHRVVDDGYRAFFELATTQIVAAIRNARAYAHEQRRAEELAALDRAKTVFFSNISHEFRTPLTLMIGPTEDALAATPAALSGTQLEVVHRNELRLLRLVNTLLDFSRIEAGRIQATFEHTDVADLTRSLASSFEAAIMRGGLRYDIEVAAVGDDVCVDRDLWEKIVLNLLSNAFKFTFEGSIRLALRRDRDRIVLAVTDTGIGIAASELPRVFERFHRIEGAKSRTNEGSGIGLALVSDLVGLHGGTIDITSDLGKGTTVTVAIPAGHAHLPADRVSETQPARRTGRILALSDATAARAFTAEAMRWVDTDAPVPTPVTSSAHIIFADDNADMRDYVSGLLRRHGFAVETVGDGEQALSRARARRPDLLLCDIMMPNLDGYGVIEALRKNPATATIPVVVLSARAGEEARIEGLARGANDYLAKPFSARELIARVQAQLASSRLQRVEAEARERLRLMVLQAPVAMALYSGPTHIAELANERAIEIVGVGDMLGRPIGEMLPRPDNDALIETFDRVYQTGEPFLASNYPVKFHRAGVLEEHLLQLHLVPMRDTNGVINGLLTIGVDVTDLAAARAEAERANRAKDEFLAILGHELRNPLAPILTALDIMRMRDKAPPRELDVIERQANHLVRLVDDLLDVSRITRGKLELQQRRIELAQVVARAVETATPLLEQRNHHLIVDVAFHGLLVFADLERLAQAVSNLLTNAAKYTERGGAITVSARRVGADVVLTVADTGIGIAREMLPYVFDMFVQERQALDRASGGLGLGLTIVRSLTAMHAGRVEVTSAGRDKGSQFTMILPAAETRSETARIPREISQPVEVATPTARVLVVDDNVDAAEMLSSSLEMSGYETRVAHDGPEALRVIGEFTPDIVLLDIGLPVMDGYELAVKLRQVPELARVRLVALTGYGLESDRKRSKQAGFDAHLVKPVTLDAVRKALASMLPP